MSKDIYRGPVSVKGVVFEDKKVWLRKNQRNEWELPGGKMDFGEQPEKTVVRELREELGLDTKVIEIIQAHYYVIKISEDETAGVLVITYLCEIKKRVGDFEYEGEGGKAEFEKFSLEELQNLNMPEFYKEAIKKAYENNRNI